MNNDIQKKAKALKSALDSMRINRAVSIVKEMLSTAGLTSQLSEVDRIAETYSYMTRYLLDGARDSSRDAMLSDMSQQLLAIGDLAVRESFRNDNPGYYYATLRFVQLRKENIARLLEDYGRASSELTLAEAAENETRELRKVREDILERLFNTLFTSLGADNDYREIKKYLLSGYSDRFVTAQSLSAITLSLLVYYDRGKMNLLLDLYENSEEVETQARALTGIVLAMVRNSERIKSDKTLMSRMSLWNDSLQTYTQLLEVLRVIIGTRDTERITNKIKDEVLPELMKLRPEIMKNLREHPELDASMLEDNPEWTDMLRDSGLEKKMEELSELQSDGADLLMVTFSNLKQFPFFNKACNWFLPFDINNSEISLNDDMKRMVEMLTMSGAITCDSDLYSLALAANHVPKAQMDMMNSQISANFEQLREQQKADEELQSQPEFKKEVLRTVRDLYRFFKLFRRREDFFDPFAKPLQFTQLPVVGDMMQDNEVLRLFGEFYFKRGFYGDALPLLSMLATDHPEDEALWEKIGFCYQSMKLFAEAREAYEKAALLKQPGPWLVNKLAYVNRRLGNYAEAAEHYANALSMDPENLNLIMNAGNMQLESGDIAGALGQFYHANYLSPDNPRVLRAVAWTELLNGNRDKAADYYQRVINIGAQASDYLNSGHVALLRGNNREALNFYNLAREHGEADFEEAFMADLPVLEKLGAERTGALLLLDMALA